MVMCNHNPKTITGFPYDFTFCSICGAEWSNIIHNEWRNSMYTRQFSSYDACDEAAEEWSKNHPGHYYVSTVDTGCYEISCLSEYDGEPYWQNGEFIYPEE